MNLGRLGVILTCVVAAVLAVPPAAAQPHAAGHQSLRIVDDPRTRPIQLDIWYPAAGQERPHNYGLGTGRVVSPGGVSGGRFPLLVLSHGAMGAASNYSWLAEALARRGYVVLGVSHFRESPAFGPDAIDPASAGRFGDRTRDLTVATDFLLTRSPYAQSLDPERIGLIGHSSGGATVLMLAGATFSAAALAAYCGSSAAAADKGCAYPVVPVEQRAGQEPVRLARRIRAAVLLDPAVGPGFTGQGGGDLAVLVVGAVRGDFLPYSAHAERIAAMVPGAQLVRLDAGEGHFVFIDECRAPIEVMGVPLRSDQQGVDRKTAHGRLIDVVERFLCRYLSK